MQKLDLIGMKLDSDQERILKRKLSLLADQAPANSTIHLRLEKRKSCIKGTLTIRSFTEFFGATKVTSDPLQTFQLLNEEIESQLLEWKRYRFNSSISADNRYKRQAIRASA